MFKNLLENPRSFFEYYFSQFNQNFKDIDKSDRDKMLYNEIDQIISQLQKYKPCIRSASSYDNPDFSRMRPPYS
jgi:hypothetical protein